MATLQRTIAFKQIYRIAVAISKDLNFNVTRGDNQLFNQAMIIAKAALRFAFATDQRVFEFRRLFNRAHAFATTASRCLDQNRIADLFGLGRKEIRVLIRAMIARNQRYPGFTHDFLGFGF